MDKESLSDLKIILRETDIPFFNDEELQYHLNKAGGDVELAAYRLLIIKAETCPLQISGLSLADTSAYWLRLAQMYRPNYSGVVKGG